MRTFLFFFFIVVTLILGETIFSLEFDKLSDYGIGFLIGKSIWFIVCLAGLYFTGRGIFKKISV
ncbi:hypothetical protein WG947_13805 [Pontibacter sp. H259]|uniref:hypothetical protein n=1 Tax=Pontibacter sp. H259 TaxID=3133421 RepID=UPI0030C54477